MALQAAAREAASPMGWNSWSFGSYPQQPGPHSPAPCDSCDAVAALPRALAAEGDHDDAIDQDADYQCKLMEEAQAMRRVGQREREKHEGHTHVLPRPERFARGSRSYNVAAFVSGTGNHCQGCPGPRA
eukprot:scaffold29230_cov55-Phaeocystis_antarctica.AAC.5